LEFQLHKEIEKEIVRRKGKKLTCDERWERWDKLYLDVIKEIGDKK